MINDNFGVNFLHYTNNYHYLSVWTGAGSDFDASEGLLPVLGKMMFSPSDLSLSTKSSTSFPLPTNLSALLEPLDLNHNNEKNKDKNTVHVTEIKDMRM